MTNPLTLKILKYCLLAIILPADNIFSNNDSLKFSLKKISTFNYIDGLFGINMNQASIGKMYYEVNYQNTFQMNINILSFNNLELCTSLNLIKKVIMGTPTNEARSYFFFNKINTFYTNSNYDRINYELTYLSIDIRGKYTILKKFKLHPFISSGIRQNILIKSGYNTNFRSDDVDNFINPNLKKYFVNYLLSVGFDYELIKLNTNLIAEVELNNDKNYYTY